MNLSKQNQALILGLLILIVTGVGIFLIEDLMIRIVVGLVGLVVLWLTVRAILKKPKAVSVVTTNYDQLANQIVNFVGGLENLQSVDHCQTRVLLTVKDSSLAQVDAIRNLGIAGVLRPSNTKVQLIVKDLVQPIYQALSKVVPHA